MGHQRSQRSSPPSRLTRFSPSVARGGRRFSPGRFRAALPASESPDRSASFGSRPTILRIGGAPTCDSLRAAGRRSLDRGGIEAWLLGEEDVVSPADGCESEAFRAPTPGRGPTDGLDGVEGPPGRLARRSRSGRECFSSPWMRPRGGRLSLRAGSGRAEERPWKRVGNRAPPPAGSEYLEGETASPAATLRSRSTSVRDK